MEQEINFGKLISSGFRFYNKKPRAGQVDIVDSILKAFYVENKKWVVLNSPTGTGKSIIGLVVSYCCDQLRDRAKTKYNSWLLMDKNSLLSQYTSSINEDTLLVKGASNYKCYFLSEKFNEYKDATVCTYKVLNKKYKDNGDQEAKEIMDKHCYGCQYKKVKDELWTANNILTNYTYFLIHMLIIRKLKAGYNLHEREITIADESHVINDNFAEHNSIKFSKQIADEILIGLDKYSFYTSDKYPSAPDLSSEMKDFFKSQSKHFEVTESNYVDMITKLGHYYDELCTWYGYFSNLEQENGDHIAYQDLNRLAKIYNGRYHVYLEFIETMFEHSVDINLDERFIEIQPIFASSISDKVFLSNKVLLMSATNDKSMIEKTFGLKDEDVAFINTPIAFLRENKRVMLLSVARLTYQTLSDLSTVQRIIKKVFEIVDFHKENNERGIIVTPSFKLNSLICESLVRKYGKDIIQQEQGQKVEDLVNLFKSNSPKFNVLVSPSLFEGIDLPDDESRFQIIIKAPFPSLGNKRIELISKKYPDIYQGITVMKMVQAAGRSIRSPEDYGDTYIIDTIACDLFTSKHNSWIKQFEIHQG